MLGGVTESAPKHAGETSLQAFGYRQELKRSLGLPALIVYGLVFINPTSPFSIFGIVFNLSHGMGYGDDDDRRQTTNKLEGLDLFE